MLPLAPLTIEEDQKRGNRTSDSSVTFRFQPQQVRSIPNTSEVDDDVLEHLVIEDEVSVSGSGSSV
jgi:ribosomal protein S6